MRSIRAVVLASVFVAGFVARGGAQAAQAIQVADPLRPVVAEALEASATFRKQWDRISSERRVTVYVHVADTAKDATRRARTEIRRYSSGLLHALVALPPDDDFVELLAHEFEHVIEQIERVDLAALARVRSSGVTLRQDGAFETRRAQDAGLAAAFEAAAYHAATAASTAHTPRR